MFPGNFLDNFSWQLSVREAVEPGGVVDEDALLRRSIRRPRLKQLEQVPGIWHFALDARMRPVASPNQPLRIDLHQRFMKRARVGVIRRVLAEAMGARQLGPAPTFANGAKQTLEAFGAGAGTGAAAAPMVDRD